MSLMRRIDRAISLWNLQRSADVNVAHSVRALLRFSDRQRLARTLLDFVPQRIVRNVHTVVDVGAHTGEWTEGIIALFPECRVFAFEPTPSSALELYRRFNGDPRVSVIEKAVGRSAGTADLHLFQGSDLNSLRPADVNLEATLEALLTDPWVP